MTYTIQASSYVNDRDGFAIEVEDAGGELVLELFQSDKTGEIVLSAPREAHIPWTVVLAMIERARAARFFDERTEFSEVLSPGTGEVG